MAEIGKTPLFFRSVVRHIPRAIAWRLSVAEPLVYRPREAAAALGCGLTVLYELMAEKRLDARKLGAKTLITAESIRAYIASLPPAELATGLRAKRAART